MKSPDEPETDVSPLSLLEAARYDVQKGCA